MAGRPPSRRPPPRTRRRRSGRQWVWAVLAVLVVGGLIAAIALGSGGVKSTATKNGGGPEGISVPAGSALAAVATAPYPQPIDGIQCQRSEQVVYHIHAHLAIFVNGQPRPVPLGVGIAPPRQTSGSGASSYVTGGSCFYWLHTHAGDGVIHVESPTQTSYTLGQFFDIWGQTLAAGQVGPAVGHVTAFVNSKAYTGTSLRDIPLSSHAQIQLDVGTPVVPPQQGDVDFSGTGL